jgi:protein SCO1/2
MFLSIAADSQPKPEAGIDEKLGNVIPADIMLLDEHGQSVNFKSLVNKPTVLSFVYYRCPGLCTPLLQGVLEVVDKTDMEAGKDYNLITVSFDTRDDYQLAAEKRDNYLSSLSRKIPPESWRFLTGDSLNIAKLTDAAGWRFQRQEDGNFAHGSAIIFLSPEGRIVRYLFGIQYLPFEFKMGVIEAEENKVMPSVSKVLKMCYSYDPASRKYVFNLLQVVGTVMIVCVIALVLFLTLYKRKSMPVGQNGVMGKVS